ncbi:MAG TPA: cytochrome c peroxidase [Cyclobacteriaceae bacterium]|nr:cytochrome c peroxidase [Cyclobacteriaceae bacterium]
MRILAMACLLAACTGENNAPVQDPYAFGQPANFPSATYTFENNPVTRDGFELGRALFYDPILSVDSTIACANCHQQARSFSDPVHRFSKGVGGVSGIRNAPAIQNMAFQKFFFWDGGVNHLDFVPINAITSPIEMQETLAAVVRKIQRRDAYKKQFAKAFSTDVVDSQKLLHALSQFMAMMVSANSRYDKYVRNEGEQLTSTEFDGMRLFQSKCASCHATDLFTDGSFRNNGIDDNFDNDIGRQRITETVPDRGKFKVPSLRNAELTSPYMHDGRFRTLEEVLDHYASGVKYSGTLDPSLFQNGVTGIPMGDDEKSKIIAFIKTLTDRQFTNDKRFSFTSLN